MFTTSVRIVYTPRTVLRVKAWGNRFLGKLFLIDGNIKEDDLILS